MRHALSKLLMLGSCFPRDFANVSDGAHCSFLLLLLSTGIHMNLSWVLERGLGFVFLLFGCPDFSCLDFSERHLRITVAAYTLSSELRVLKFVKFLSSSTLFASLPVHIILLCTYSRLLRLFLCCIFTHLGFAWVFSFRIFDYRFFANSSNKYRWLNSELGLWRNVFILQFLDSLRWLERCW